MTDHPGDPSAVAGPAAAGDPDAATTRSGASSPPSEPLVARPVAHRVRRVPPPDAGSGTPSVEGSGAPSQPAPVAVPVAGVPEVSDPVDPPGAEPDRQAAAVALAERPEEPEPAASTPAPPVPEPAPLPPSKPRRHLVVTRPWRTVAVVAVLLAVALLVPLLVAVAARTIGNSTEGELDTGARPTDPGEPGIPKAVLPDTPGALVTLVDESGVATGLVVFALSPTGSGGTVVVVPTGTEVVGGEGSSRLGDALAGGPEAQLAAVEGFLGVTLGRSEVLDREALEALLEPLAPFAVDLPFDVETDGPDGPAVLLPAGTQTLTAGEAAAVLTSRTSVGTELDRLPNEVAVWQAVARRASEAEPSGEMPPPGPDAAALVDAVLAGPTSVAEIPVDPVLDPVRNPEGIDLLEPDVAATRLLMARVLPGAVSPASDGPRFRLLNPLGDPSLTYEAVGRLVYVGAHVIIATEVAGPAPEESLVEFEDPEREAELARYAPILGGAVVRPADVDIDGVDATIVLGRSFERFMAAERARQAATTAPTSVASTAAPSSTEP